MTKIDIDSFIKQMNEDLIKTLENAQIKVTLEQIKPFSENMSDILENINDMICLLNNELDKKSLLINEEICQFNAERSQSNILLMKKEELITELQLQLAKRKK